MIDRKFRLPRIWSNNELRKFSKLFIGDIINVSGGDDFDKISMYYSDYFINKRSYTISNWPCDKFRGFSNRPNEIVIDLTKPLDNNLVERYDVVFNHTTLEHIFDLKTAIKNLCRLSRDIIILVIPFSQVYHQSDYYMDYWRFTPESIKLLLKDEGFDLIYSSYNDDFNAAIYLFCIATKNKIKWDLLIKSTSLSLAGRKIGGLPQLKEIIQINLTFFISIFRKAFSKIINEIK